MSRVLYWNLQNFSLNKICNFSSPAALAESQNRFAHIVVDVFNANVPEIFVVAEGFARTTNEVYESTLVGVNSNLGVAALLTLFGLHIGTGNLNWRLVPLINLGASGWREAFAVFYDSTNLQFIGPYVWGTDFTTTNYLSTGKIKSQPIYRACAPADTIPPGGYAGPMPAGPQLYPSTWGLVLPNRVTPAGYTNALTPENRLAGQGRHFTAAGAKINFPNSFNRSPYLTSFIDHAHGGRVINVYSIHTSPASAVWAVNAIDSIPSVQNVAANQVNVIIGDFNVDSFDMMVNGAYVALLNRQYTLGLDSRNWAHTVDPNRFAYCATHLLPTLQATPFNTVGHAADNQHNVYPRFGYMDGAIDNVLTRYGVGAFVPVAANVSIANTVVGHPYNQLFVPPPGVTPELLGGLVYNSSLANPIPQPVGYPDPTGGEPAQFAQWNNFDRIRSVSDHLALCIDV